MSPRYRAKQMAHPAFTPDHYKNSIAGQQEAKIEEKIDLFCGKLKSLLLRRSNGKDGSLDPQGGKELQGRSE